MDESRVLFDDDREVSLTFARGLDLLEAFAGQERGLSVAELAARTGFNRAVTRRLVRTLEKKGYAEANRGLYELTPRVLRLIRGFVEGRDLPQILNPILRRAAEQVGESVSFAMLDGHEAVYVAHAPLPARFTLNRAVIGARVPLAPTAVGRCLLAFSPEGEMRCLMAELGVTEADLPFRALRRQGYVASRGEYVPGVASIAVPVFDGRGQLHGALSIIYLEGGRDPADVTGPILAHLKAAARDLGGALQ